MHRRFRVGDRVVFTRDKYSNKPGPRAKNVFAAPNGETYSYQVEKFWVVVEVCGDNTLAVRTRRGKVHTIKADDPRLRKASFWERWFHAERFPTLTGGVDASSSSWPQHQAASRSMIDG